MPIHDLMEIVESPFYSMPFYRGRTLKAAIESIIGRRRTIPSPTLRCRELLDNFIAVCHAIAYAHSRNTIHRDIKGANVQIDSFGRSIVLDWGLAEEATKGEDPLEERGQSETDDPTVLREHSSIRPPRHRRSAPSITSRRNRPEGISQDRPSLGHLRPRDAALHDPHRPGRPITAKGR